MWCGGGEGTFKLDVKEMLIKKTLNQSHSYIFFKLKTSDKTNGQSILNRFTVSLRLSLAIVRLLYVHMGARWSRCSPCGCQASSSLVLLPCLRKLRGQLVSQRLVSQSCTLD